MKAVEKFLDAFVNESVVGDVIGPVIELLLSGQLAIQNQVGGFEISALLREFLDGIAAVTEDAFVAVDKSDAADAGGGVVERRVIAHQAEIIRAGLDLADIN